MSSKLLVSISVLFAGVFVFGFGLVSLEMESSSAHTLDSISSIAVLAGIVLFVTGLVFFLLSMLQKIKKDNSFHIYIS